eukprot:TRINITY_DN8954_c0_g1_i1.p1 TRINITY_DN8954_c0_g1~~TRINITY_DN8954_c0_g1_i1.p1  ORF type:complete len:137 (-),score=36.01 TRINITY_DN8954_c0_g1_i1:65-475(-)
MALLWDPVFRELRFPTFHTNNSDATSINWTPRIDIDETENELVILMELPGLNEKDVKLNFRSGALEVYGEKVREKKDERTKSHHEERLFGKFTRRIQLPAGVDPKALKATFNNGLLKIVVQKPDKEKDFVVPIARL